MQSKRLDSKRDYRFLGIFGLALVMAGCAAKPSQDVLLAGATGEMSAARVRLSTKIGAAAPPPKPTQDDLKAIEKFKKNKQKAEVNPKSVDRDYLLDRARLLSLMLGDGYNAYAGSVVDELNRLLRTQGLNSNRKVASILINEDVKIWKGEPFEQAMALCWVGMHYGMQGDWETVRIASDNSLFQLQDFGTRQDPKSGGSVPHTTESLGIAMARNEVLDEQAADNGYQLVDSNFVLGYLLNAIANQQIGRQAEADDNYRKALKYNAALGPTIAQFKSGQYNTILIVEYGVGPQKRGTGTDNVFAKFVPMVPSDQLQLSMSTATSKTIVPPAMDLNAIATDLMWNNLEDVRLAKSYVGTALVAGGAAYALNDLGNDPASALIGGITVLAGLFIKAQAHVDTRYCEILPQRVYAVPMMIQGPEDEIVFEIDEKPGTRMVVSGIDPPTDGGVKMHYLRLPSAFAEAPPQWAVQGDAIYSNVYDRDCGQIELPYILGGHCVMPPSEKSLAKYQAAGFLTDYTLQDLVDLYIAEKLVWEYAHGELPGLHVLDGGNSLAMPEPGTTGYNRLMRTEHPPYRAKSKQARAAIAGLPQPLIAVTTSSN